MGLLKVAPYITLATMAVALAAFIHQRSAWSGSGFKDDPAEWPAPLQSLLVDSPSIAQNCEVFIIDAFIDQKSVWLIRKHDADVARLISENQLLAADSKHPKLAELLRLLPPKWAKPSIADATIYATEGYGVEHIESDRLLLVVQDEASNCTYVLHESIF